MTPVDQAARERQLRRVLIEYDNEHVPPCCSRADLAVAIWGHPPRTPQQVALGSCTAVLVVNRAEVGDPAERGICRIVSDEEALQTKDSEASTLRFVDDRFDRFVGDVGFAAAAHDGVWMRQSELLDYANHWHRLPHQAP